MHEEAYFANGHATGKKAIYEKEQQLTKKHQPSFAYIY